MGSRRVSIGTLRLLSPRHEPDGERTEDGTRRMDTGDSGQEGDICFPQTSLVGNQSGGRSSKTFQVDEECVLRTVFKPWSVWSQTSHNRGDLLESKRQTFSHPKY